MVFRIGVSGSEVVLPFGGWLISLWNGIRRAFNPVICPESALESDREARPGGFCELRPPWSTLRVLVSRGYLCLLIHLYIRTHIYV